MFLRVPSYLTRQSYLLNDTSPSEFYTLSLHDALPISSRWFDHGRGFAHQALESAQEQIGDTVDAVTRGERSLPIEVGNHGRSEEHTSELQSHVKVVCRHLLEKKKNSLVKCLRKTRE